MKREDFFFALNETTHTLRFAEAAAGRFNLDTNEFEVTAATAAALCLIRNRLADAQASLGSAKDEISRLIQKNEVA